MVDLIAQVWPAADSLLFRRQPAKDFITRPGAGWHTFGRRPQGVHRHDRRQRGGGSSDGRDARRFGAGVVARRLTIARAAQGRTANLPAHIHYSVSRFAINPKLTNGRDFQQADRNFLLTDRQ